MHTLPLIGRMDNWSGYGQFTAGLIRAWYQTYGPVEFFARSRDDTYGKLPDIEARLTPRRNHGHDWELILYAANEIRRDQMQRFKRTVVFTMWESSRMRPEVVDALNAAALVIVPCEWCVHTFSANGVNTPMEIVPLGVDLEFWNAGPSKRKPMVGRKVVFGTAGKWSGGGVRKGARLVMEAFLEAFSGSPYASLKVKGFPDDPIPSTAIDNRIEIDKNYMSDEQLRDWFDSIDFFVSGSGMEGWGLMQQQAMLRGAPVIGAITGGVAEFCDERNCFPVPWSLAPGEGPYQGLGHYPKLDKAQLSAAIWQAFDKAMDWRDGVLDDHRVAAFESASRFSIENSAATLHSVLVKHGFLKA